MKIEQQNRNIYWAFLVFLILIVLANGIIFAPYLLAVFLGWIMAAVLAPMDYWLVGKGMKPRNAALTTTLAALFTIIIPVVGFGFAFVKNLFKVIAPLAKSGLNVDAWVAKIYSIPLAHRVFDDQEEFRVFFDENSKRAIEAATTTLSGYFAATPELVLQLFLALLACYYILVDGKAMREWMSARVPMPTETKSDFVKGLNDMAYSSFLSMLAAAVAQSLIVFVGFLVLGVPMATLALGVAFVFAWFPIFGVAPVWIAAAIYLMVTDQPGAAIGMALFGITASLIDNVVRPWVLKGRADLHPLISLVAIFGSIKYFGIIGVLVGPIMASSCIEFLRIWPEFSKHIGLAPMGEHAPVKASERK